MTVGSNLHCKGADYYICFAHLSLYLLVGHPDKNFYWLSKIQNEAKTRRYTHFPSKKHVAQHKNEAKQTLGNLEPENKCFS